MRARFNFPQYAELKVPAPGYKQYMKTGAECSLTSLMNPKELEASGAISFVNPAPEPKAEEIKIENKSIKPEKDKAIKAKQGYSEMTITLNAIFTTNIVLNAAF